MSNATTTPPKSRVGQMREAYKITKRSDSNIALILLLTFLVVGGVMAGPTSIPFGHSTFGLITTALFGALTGVL